MVHLRVRPCLWQQRLGQRDLPAVAECTDSGATQVEQPVNLGTLLQTEHSELECPQRLLPAYEQSGSLQPHWTSETKGTQEDAAAVSPRMRYTLLGKVRKCRTRSPY